ncbi:hypothetical protein QE152_g34842 [Popillia japonica]|uniref:Uncharacterized protein n=1 Tax=Popillia japonica TaxID=7064 RepID=A0AAW1ITK1_POPJA
MIAVVVDVKENESYQMGAKIVVLKQVDIQNLNMIAVVVDVKENESYQMGAKIVVLKQVDIQNLPPTCSEDLINIKYVDKDKEVLLREVDGKLFSTGGSGFKECNCLI